MTREGKAPASDEFDLRPDSREMGCPDEHLLAAYADGTLDPADRVALEAHLSGCERCVDVIGVLGGLRDDSKPEPVPDLLVAKARRFARTRRPTWRRMAPQWAAAALALLAVPLLVENIGVPRPDESPAQESQVRTTRNGPTGAPTLRILAPRPEATVSRDALTVRWDPVPGSSYYDVRIVTDVGDIVVEQQVNGTTWRPTAAQYLRPGVEYFVHVDAYSAGDKAVRSDHIPFRVSD